MISQALVAATVAIFLYLTATSSWAGTKKAESYPAVEQDVSEIVQMPEGPAADEPVATGAAAMPAAEAKTAETEESADAPLAIPAPIAIENEEAAPKIEVKKGKKAAHAKKEIPAKKSATAAVANKDFDPVPESQVGPVIKRLKLVALILRDYGRAYDYRMHTVAELEKILSDLQHKKSNS